MELNGAPVEADQLAALALTNYGHFTTMLVADGRVRGLGLHLARLERDCLRLFDAELDRERVRELVRRAAGRGPVIARVTIFDARLGLSSVGADARPDVLVTTRPAGAAPPAPCRLLSVPHRREDPAVKHVGLCGALRQRRVAQRAGFDDALLRNPDGTISESTTSNIGLVRGDRVVWPESPQLAGVTMALLNRSLGESAGSAPVADLSDVDAAFTTNAATGIRPIAAVDELALPARHPVLDDLRERYAAIPGEEL